MAQASPGRTLAALGEDYYKGDQGQCHWICGVTWCWVVSVSGHNIL